MTPLPAPAGARRAGARLALSLGTLALLAVGSALSPAPVRAESTSVPARDVTDPVRIVEPPPPDLSLSVPPGTAPGDSWRLKPTVPDVMALHSRPGSAHTIYLNFEGADLSGSDWTSLLGAPLGFLARAADLDGVAGALSTRERALVELVWRHVSEDFAPFDVDVTTQRPPADALDRTSSTDTTYGVQVVFTDDAWLKRSCSGCTGIASLGVFQGPGTDAYREALVFPGWFVKSVLPQMGPQFAARLLGTTASHEIGHTLGLKHDGLLASSPIGALDYHPGFSPGGPIMGSTVQPVTRWADTSMPWVDNDQDDLGILTARLGLVPDEPDAVPLSTGVPARGTLSTATDVDTFTYRATKAATVTASVDDPFADLDLALTVTDDLGGTSTYDPPAKAKGWTMSGLGATAKLVAGRTYRISVAPASTPGLGAYDSLGRYGVVVRVG